MTEKEKQQNRVAEKRIIRMKARHKLGLPQYKTDLKKENIRFLPIEE